LFLKDESDTVCEIYPKGIPVYFIRGEKVCRKIIPIEGREDIIKAITGKRKK
jgi:hypothetical protein